MARRLDDRDDGQVLDRPQPQQPPLEIRPAERPRGRQSDGSAEIDHGERERGGFFHRNLILIVAIAVAVIALAGYVYWDHARHFESTDDAYVESRQFAVAPKVAG